MPGFLKSKGDELFDDRFLSVEVFKNAIGTFFEGGLRAIFRGDEEKEAAEGMDGDINRSGGFEITAEDFFVGVEEANFPRSRVAESDCLVESNGACDRFPGVIAQCDEAGFFAASRDGIGAIFVLREYDAFGEDFIVATV